MSFDPLFLRKLYQNILGIAVNKTYIMFQPDVAVTYSSRGIMANMFGSFLASNLLVRAKLKTRYTREVDGIKTY